MSGLMFQLGLRITWGGDKAVTDLVDIAPRRGVMSARMALGGLMVIIHTQRGALMPWSAVMLGLGVSLYFALPQEPGRAGFALAGFAVLTGTAVAIFWRDILGPLGVAVALIGLGVLAAGHRAQSVAGPVLEFRYYGAIEGRVVGVDRSGSDAIRVTLDQVRLEELAPERTPRRVRVALHGDSALTSPKPGTVVMLTGHLTAPAGPAEPGGFDFQLHAHFLSLGAVGYTRTPVMLLTPRESGALSMFALRMAMSAEIQARIPGQAGAFASAVLTGDRSALTEATTASMRDTNIAHILSISGLHMVLLTGFVYSAARLILALIPPLALRYPIRKWAAVLALAAGAFYLALSGGGVPTERAFIQVAVMFAAVLIDRRAITLRSVAIAGVIVLLYRPETLLSPGFQMSFAATVALVGAFAALREAHWQKRWPGWAKGALALVLSSVVAGAATAPYAAAHFNQMSNYGLLANLLTVPVMGSLIMPAAVVAAILWPIGLSGPVWVVMGWGLNWTLWVAEEIAAWPGAVRLIGDPPGWALAAVSLGGLFVLLWQGRARWLGVVPCLAAVALWTAVPRPMLLVSDSGGLVGLMSDGARALSRDRGNGFAAEIWLENDGDPALQPEAAARPDWAPDGSGARAEMGGWTIWHGAGRGGLEGALAACARHDIVVLSEPAPEALMTAAAEVQAALAGPFPVALPRLAGCVVLDAKLLATTGALSLAPQGDALMITTSRMLQGDRPWSPQP